MYIFAMSLVLFFVAYDVQGQNGYSYNIPDKPFGGPENSDSKASNAFRVQQGLSWGQGLVQKPIPQRFTVLQNSGNVDSKGFEGPGSPSKSTWEEPSTTQTLTRPAVSKFSALLGRRLPFLHRPAAPLNNQNDKLGELGKGGYPSSWPSSTGFNADGQTEQPRETPSVQPLEPPQQNVAAMPNGPQGEFQGWQGVGFLSGPQGLQGFGSSSRNSLQQEGNLLRPKPIRSQLNNEGGQKSNSSTKVTQGTQNVLNSFNVGSGPGPQYIKNGGKACNKLPVSGKNSNLTSSKSQARKKQLSNQGVTKSSKLSISEQVTTVLSESSHTNLTLKSPANNEQVQSEDHFNRTTSQSDNQHNQSSQKGDFSSIPGMPDVDYPILSKIPSTAFRCENQQHPGYYADVEARCQVFHICANNQSYDFLCPNGTIFHQKFLVCVWWNQFDCNSAPALYGTNANLYNISKKSSLQQNESSTQANQGHNNLTVSTPKPSITTTDTSRNQGSSGTTSGYSGVQSMSRPTSNLLGDQEPDPKTEFLGSLILRKPTKTQRDQWSSMPNTSYQRVQGSSGLSTRYARTYPHSNEFAEYKVTERIREMVSQNPSGSTNIEDSVPKIGNRPGVASAESARKPFAHKNFTIFLP